MRSASVRVATASLLAIAGACAVRFGALPDGREKVAALFGVELERPRRYLIQCAEDAVDCADWYHDELIPSGWDYLLLYSGLIATMLCAGYFASRGVPMNPARGAITGALVGMAISVITLRQLFSIPDNLLTVAVPTLMLQCFLVLVSCASIGYVGGRLARSVA
jgi:hypothetical protein